MTEPLKMPERPAGKKVRETRVFTKSWARAIPRESV